MRLRDMSPGSATVWYAFLVNASMMRRSVLASTTGRLQPAAFIGTIVTTTSRAGRGSLASDGPASGGRRATTREVFMGFRSPWFSSSRSTDSSGVQRLQPWWQRHHHRHRNEFATKSRFAATPTAAAAAATGAERESGIPLPTAAGGGAVVKGDSGSGRSDKSATPAAAMKVTLLSGFLGAGKTTLMSNVLRQAREEKLSLAVIVNDMADINVDAQLLTLGNGLDQGDLAAAGASGSAVAGESSSGVTSVAMQDGCICCTLKDELLLEVGAMAKEGKYDHLIIESTGISDPAPVAEALVESDCSTNDTGYFFDGEDDDDDDDEESTGSAAPLERGESEAVGGGGGEGGMYSLDTLVTVVDSTSFLDEVRKADDLEERGLESGEGDTRTIADLLMSQVEFANVILLNKSDLATEEDMAALEGLVRRLNPTARVERTVSSAVGLAEVLGTGEFDLEEASKAAGWLRLANEHSPA
ncbi:cobalamin synthesis protein, P47K [Ectocarpus siliculosus]|uniref:Cobalamin synthesis protein, P47K n=1 Tax=Ectocarpus siliculosus TaxID=2880 RepID=D7G7B4_ECTSI|nr:cobalamin synthesis protein, P47K [Ectocarpus siliculosus]|eukprot:CBJ27665.1 cobalamin synthesis protein, P47K [Ectocarpus siliculosus]